MPPVFDAVYLSPHLDDVALSCGGQIFNRAGAGERIFIITIMAGPPPPGPFSAFAAELHDRWELPKEATAARRREDARASEILGADYSHWEFPDAVYRRHPQDDQILYPTWEDVIRGINPAESPLIAQLAARLGNLPAAAEIISPLGVGNHVDHLLVRAAARRAFGPKLIYYEDFPYAREGAGVTAVHKKMGGRWIPESFTLDPPALRAKAQAILSYRSQMSSFFSSSADLRHQLQAHAAAVGGERCWRQLG